MSFRLVPKSVTLNDLERCDGRYFTEFDKPVYQHIPGNRIYLWLNLCTSLLYFVVHVRCRRKESSRSLSHLLVSFLYSAVGGFYACFSWLDIVVCTLFSTCLGKIWLEADDSRWGGTKTVATVHHHHVVCSLVISSLWQVIHLYEMHCYCLLYTSDAADE